MIPNLLIFIDSFPFYYLDNAPFLGSLPHRTRVIPGFGYSSTCQVELFSGLTPDDLGHFGEWTYDPGNSPFRRYRGLLKIASPVSRIYYLDRIVHRLLGKISKIQMKNIPLPYLGYFTHPYVSVFDERFPHDSLMKLANVTRVCSYDFGSLPWPAVDGVVYDHAKRLISELPADQHLLVSMTKLDAVGHRFGVDSPRYHDKVLELDRWVEDLYNHFVARFPTGRLAVISDHGMVNINRDIAFHVEETFGRPQIGRYFYFLDGTLFRAWVDDDGLERQMADYLQSLGVGSLITPSERASFGLTNPSFGDLIFVLDTSLMFVPSFWGGRSSLGMHGYHPADPTQHGIFLASSVSDDQYDNRDALRTVEVYDQLRDLLLQGNGE